MSDNKFFEYGEVILAENDHKTRQACINICMPCYLLQAVTPVLLGNGLIDELKVREPVVVWLPQLSTDRINPSILQQVPDVNIRINSTIKNHVNELLKLFQGASSIISNPADLVPCLPLGVYVQFIYRCEIDNIPKLLEGIDKVKVPGVPEFMWSFAHVLKQTLNEFKTLMLNKS